MTEMPVWLPICFFVVAFFYSMVGFGGGSSYLALLVLSGMSYSHIPPLALVCNLIVTTGGCWHFYKAGHLKFEKVLPFVVLSVPLAYLGGSIPIAKDLFCLLLGFSLMAVAIRMLLPGESSQQAHAVSMKKSWSVGVPLGGLLGFLSGLVGIGGGVFLSPLLLLLRWANVREAAASSSFFIIVNSFSGLMGQLHKGSLHLEWMIPLGLSVFFGGQIGARLGAYKIPRTRLQQALGALVFYVSFRLLAGGF